MECHESALHRYDKTLSFDPASLRQSIHWLLLAVLPLNSCICAFSCDGIFRSYVLVGWFCSQRSSVTTLGVHQTGEPPLTNNNSGSNPPLLRYALYLSEHWQGRGRAPVHRTQLDIVAWPLTRLFSYTYSEHAWHLVVLMLLKGFLFLVA